MLFIIIFETPSPPRIKTINIVIIIIVIDPVSQLGDRQSQLNVVVYWATVGCWAELGLDEFGEAWPTHELTHPISAEFA